MATPTESTPIPIIDAHVHLYPEAEHTQMTWTTLAPDSPFAARHSMVEYAAATGGPCSELRGYVFVETNRKSGPDHDDWAAGPLPEVSWLRRLVTPSEALEGEGVGPDHGRLLLGAVPWAPLSLGPDQVDKYLAEAEARAGPAAWAKVKGFRYLLQDKPAGTGLTDDFIASLKLLGRRGYVFDVGVDQHRRGRSQLEETVDMIDRAHEGVPEEEKVVFVLNHLCKPDLTIISQTDPSFIAWRTAMFTLSRCSKTYMKLSGCFSEMSDRLKNQAVDEVLAALLPWLAVVLAAFGPARIMFGSDWPVCTLGVKDDEPWPKWRKVVERMLWMSSLSLEDQACIWNGTARKAYNLDA